MMDAALPAQDRKHRGFSPMEDTGKVLLPRGRASKLSRSRSASRPSANVGPKPQEALHTLSLKPYTQPHHCPRLGHTLPEKPGAKGPF